MKIWPHPLPHYPHPTDNHPRAQSVRPENLPPHPVSQIMTISRTMPSITSHLKALHSTMLILILSAIIKPLPLGALFCSAILQCPTLDPLTQCIPTTCPTTNSIGPHPPSTPKRDPQHQYPHMIVTIAPMPHNLMTDQIYPPITIRTDLDMGVKGDSMTS